MRKPCRALESSKMMLISVLGMGFFEISKENRMVVERAWCFFMVIASLCGKAYMRIPLA